MINYQQSSIILPTLSRFERSNILLIDFLLKEALHNQITIEPGAIELDDVVYLYVIQTKENKWMILFAPTVIPDEGNHKYKTVLALTIGDILYLAEHEVDRHKVIQNLLPVGLIPIPYHDMGKSSRLNEN